MISDSPKTFDSPKTLGREDFLRLFAEVDEILVSNKPLGETIKAAVCGGAAIAMMNENRRTVDVDIISDNLPPELREAIKIVGNRNDLPPDWMNDGAKIWGFKSNVYMERIFSGRRLHLYRPDADCLLILKLEATRKSDKEDIQFLKHESTATTAEELLETAESVIPRHRLTPQLNFRIISLFQDTG